MIHWLQSWGFLALVSLPIIVLLYSLRPKRRDLRVSSNRLWREALGERQRGLGFYRLLRNVSLLLLLLAALALSLALIEPQWLTAVRESGDQVVILDTSASMKAKASGVGSRLGAALGETRFEAAVRRVEQLIDDLAQDQRMLLMTSGERPRLIAAFSNDRDGLRRSLRDVSATDEAGRPQSAWGLARALLADREHAGDGDILFITDGAFEGGPDADVRVLNVLGEEGAATARNVAITQFDIREVVGFADRFEIMVSLRSYLDEPVQVPLTITMERRRLARRDIELAPGAREQVHLAFDLRPRGRVTATIEVDDDLETDNLARAVINAAPPARVLLVSPGNPYLEAVFEAMPGAVSSKSESISPDELPRAARAHDLVVLDGQSFDALPPGRYLLVNSTAGDLPFLAGPPRWLIDPRVDRVESGPLTAGLDFSGLRINRARQVVLPPDAAGTVPLLSSEGSRLVLAYLDDRRRLIYLGFDLAQSNFPAQAAFPLLVRAGFDWLVPRRAEARRTWLPAGTRYHLRGLPDGAEVLMRLPSTEALVLRAKGSSMRFEDTAQAGYYRYSVNGVAQHFAVNGIDRHESDIRPRAPVAPPVDGPNPSSDVLDADTDAAHAARALWPYLLLAGLLLLSLEWMVHIRVRE